MVILKARLFGKLARLKKYILISINIKAIGRIYLRIR